jgi:hypothetical protein
VYLICTDPGARNGPANGGGAQLRSGASGQFTLKTAHWRADCRKNHHIGRIHVPVCHIIVVSWSLLNACRNSRPDCPWQKRPLWVIIN